MKKEIISLGLVILSIFFLSFLQKVTFLPGSEGKIRLEITVIDEMGKEYQSIEEVRLDQKSLTLNIADPSGNRGVYYFQVAPGRHSIDWTIQSASNDWPRSKKYHKEIYLEAKDKWVYLTIEGKDFTMN